MAKLAIGKTYIKELSNGPNVYYILTIDHCNIRKNVVDLPNTA